MMKASTELIKEYLGKGGVSDSTLSELASFCEIKVYEANDIVYRKHDESMQLYIVHSGQVDIQYTTSSGKRETIDSCFKGDFLVWSAMVQPYRTSSSGICRARAKILAFDGVKLRELCENDTDFGYKVMGLIARAIRRRLQVTRNEIVDLR